MRPGPRTTRTRASPRGRTARAAVTATSTTRAAAASPATARRLPEQHLRVRRRDPHHHLHQLPRPHHAYRINDGLPDRRRDRPARRHHPLRRYDRYDRLLSRTDPLGRTTTYAYDDDGPARPQSPARTADDHRVDYNDLGLPVTVTGPGRRHLAPRRTTSAGNRTVGDRPRRRTHPLRLRRARPSRRPSPTPLGAHDPRPLRRGRACPSRSPTRSAPSPATSATPSAGPSAVTDPLGRVTRLEWTRRGPARPRAPAPTAPPSPGRTTARATASPTPTRRAASPATSTPTSTCSAARTGPDGVRYEFDHDAELRLTQVTNPRA